MPNFSAIYGSNTINHTNIVFDFSIANRTWDGDGLIWFVQNGVGGDIPFDYFDESSTIAQPYGVTALNNGQQQAIIDANTLWKNLISTSSLVGHSGTSEILVFLDTIETATNPSDSNDTKTASGVNHTALNGDDIIDRSEIILDISPGPATTAGNSTAIHELGHSYGLLDVDNQNGNFDQSMTIMSYNSLIGKTFEGPMALDIAAIQYLYGTPTADTLPGHYDESDLGGISVMRTI